MIVVRREKTRFGRNQERVCWGEEKWLSLFPPSFWRWHRGSFTENEPDETDNKESGKAEAANQITFLIEDKPDETDNRDGDGKSDTTDQNHQRQYQDNNHTSHANLLSWVFAELLHIVWNILIMH